MKYKEKDIEFANQILTRRSELDDDEVRMWMDDPEHAEILKEFAAIQGLYVHVDFEKDRIEEYARFERVTGGRSHRRIVVWSSVAASVILMVGLYFSWMLGSYGEVSPLGLAGQAESLNRGLTRWS